MKLSQYKNKDDIYIDANIFIYVILENKDYSKECKKFLERVEEGRLNAIISPLVMDEVCYKIIVEKLKKEIGSKTNYEILERVKKEPEILNKVQSELNLLSFILQNYKGLRIVSVKSGTVSNMIENIIEYDLLPRDALHLSIMSSLGIENIATNDPDFQRIKNINVYTP